jgi:hypothetical protein
MVLGIATDTFDDAVDTGMLLITERELPGTAVTVGDSSSPLFASAPRGVTASIKKKSLASVATSGFRSKIERAIIFPPLSVSAQA